VIFWWFFADQVGVDFNVFTPATSPKRSGCARCGYPRAPGEARCPECNAGYSRDGVPAYAIKKRMGPPTLVIGAFLLLVAMITGIAIHPLMLRVANKIEYGTYRVERLERYNSTGPALGPEGAPSTRPDYRFTMEAKLIVDGARTRILRGTFPVALTGSSVTDVFVDCDAASGAWTLRDDAGTTLDSGTGLKDAVASMYWHSGADSLWPGSAAEVDDARECAARFIDIGPTAVSTSRFMSYGLSIVGASGSGSGGSVPAPAVLITVEAGAWATLITTALGLTWLAHSVRRRRFHAKLDEPDTEG
jgi:hypothetical protein